MRSRSSASVFSFFSSFCPATAMVGSRVSFPPACGGPGRTEGTEAFCARHEPDDRQRQAAKPVKHHTLPSRLQSAVGCAVFNMAICIWLLCSSSACRVGATIRCQMERDGRGKRKGMSMAPYAARFPKARICETGSAKARLFDLHPADSRSVCACDWLWIAKDAERFSGICFQACQGSRACRARDSSRLGVAPRLGAIGCQRSVIPAFYPLLGKPQSQTSRFTVPARHP